MVRCFALFCLLLAVLPAVAGTLLFDFEAADATAGWHDEGGTKNERFPVTREPRWATSGQFALCFRSPQWGTGLAEWPAAEVTPPLTDWSAYERLAWDVVNPTPFALKLHVFIADDGRATRNGFNYPVELAPHSYHGAEIPLAQLKAAGLDLRRIRVLHWFTERPPGPLELYLDQVVLLKAGEPRPQPPTAWLRQLGELQAGPLQALADRVARVSQAGSAGLRRSLAGLTQRLAELLAQARAGDPAVLRADAQRRGLEADLDRLTRLAELLAEFAPQQPQVAAGPQVRRDIVVGFASSMEKVLPRGPAPTLHIASSTSLSLARNEKESLQVVVAPTELPAKAVEVRVADLAGPNGAVFAAKQITACPVGYVETKTTPPYGSSHVGWWPDPILDYLHAVDIAPGDAQAFWVRVRAPKDQPAGTYRGKLQVLSAGQPLYSFDLTVVVYPFVLPDRSPLNLATTWWPMYYEPDGAGGWREGVYRDAAWQRHKLAWGEFLADYYLSYDSLYTYPGWSPDFDVLSALQREGKLGMFNLGYYGAMPDKAAEQETWKADVRQRIGPPYRRAKELGLLAHAYIYGCDENPTELFPGVERAAAFLKQEFPGAFILTTTYDHSFGTNSVLQSMDGFCPLTPSFRADLAQKVRATGKQVWWYICCGPLHPHANMLIEYPAIEGRLLMGAQTVRYRPDGFLYYQLSIWNSPPISQAPFTDWNPRSWTSYHGDGSWTCQGPDGIPVATVRLENFRDGLEDYAYARLLEQAVKRVEAGGPQPAQAAWLADAKRLLAVPEALVHSLTDFTHDPQEVYRWRSAMAAALMASGVPPEQLTVG